ncbi:hypothetical protein G6F32_016433 [Rhizopus arrhizus]|nr:hypothetical protein G6F32_016433 [Rhizopus arrhizus]
MAADSITFIGGGNMARSLIAGLIRRGVPAAHIHVAEPVAALRQALAADFGVQVHDNAADAAAQGRTWLLAVKPQVLRDALPARSWSAGWVAICRWCVQCPTPRPCSVPA